MEKKCPQCQKATKWENNPYRPFCCEECKKRDLGKWANEEYRITDSDPSAGDNGSQSSPSES